MKPIRVLWLDGTDSIFGNSDRATEVARVRSGLRAFDYVALVSVPSWAWNSTQPIRDDIDRLTSLVRREWDVIVVGHCRSAGLVVAGMIDPLYRPRVIVVWDTGPKHERLYAQLGVTKLTPRDYVTAAIALMADEFPRK